MQVLPNGQLLSWSDDQTLRLWNLDDAEAAGSQSEPWVRTVSHPVPWDDLERVANAKRIDFMWAQVDGHGLQVAERSGRWKATWHGSADAPVCVTSAGPVIRAGRHLIWLQVLRGKAPM